MSGGTVKPDSRFVLARPLNLYETILSTSTVNVLIRVECRHHNEASKDGQIKPRSGGFDSVPSGVTVPQVELALAFTRAEHPLLRATIVQHGTPPASWFKISNEEETLSNGEKIAVPLVVEEMPISERDDADGSLVVPWQRKLAALANEHHPNETSLAHAVLTCYYGSRDGRTPDGEQRRTCSAFDLFLCLNHSGSDGPSAFGVASTFVSHLRRISSKGDTSIAALEYPKSRPFVDIHKSIPADAAAKYPLPNPPDPPYIPSVARALTDDITVALPPDSQSSILTHYFKLTARQTSGLLSNCRKHGVTVQAVLSVAGMLSVLNSAEQAKTNREEFLQCPSQAKAVFLNQVPANMRQRLGSFVQDAKSAAISNSDCACGSAAVWWPQTMHATHSLWDLAVDARKLMHESMISGFQIAWLAAMHSGNFTSIPPYTIMTSSIGIVDIEPSPSVSCQDPANSNSSCELHVTDVWMRGGAHWTPVAANAPGGIMTHVYTFAGELRLSFSYSHPQFSHELARQLGADQFKALELFSSSADMRMTVVDFLNGVAPQQTL